MAAAPLKVLLINPRATYAFEIAQKCYPPMNLLYLARQLLGAGMDVRVLDTNALRMGDEQIVDAAAEYAPDLIGLPLYTEIMATVFRAVEQLHARLPEARFVLGGPHASALPEETLAEYPNVDFVLRGECERSIVALCRALEGGADLADVPGLTWRCEGEAVSNAEGEMVTNLDSLGLPARELVADIYDLKRYYTLLVRHRPVDTIVTSRGCPFACKFCYNHNHRYRHRSTDDVMAEILSIHGRGIRDIEILDDTFTCRRERAMEVFNALIREKLPVSFRIKSRVDVVDEAFAAAAKKAGVYMISYGMESGDDEMLKRMNKRTTVADNERACRLTKRAGIACHSGWVFGYPGETPESFGRTVDFITRIKPTTAQIALLRPYPQTVAYAEAKEQGLLRGEWSVRSDEYPWVQLPWAESRADLEAVLHKAVRRIYYRPYYVWQFGKMIVAGANLTLLRYALQETRKTAGQMLGLGRKRVGSV